MLDMDQYELIRTAHRVYGKSGREIARETGHSRNTVKKALEGQPWGYSPRTHQPYPVLGPYLEIIDEMADRRAELPLQGLDGGQATVHRFLLDLGKYLSESGRCLLLSGRKWKLSEVVGRFGLKIEEGNRWERDIYGELFEVLMIARKD